MSLGHAATAAHQDKKMWVKLRSNLIDEPLRLNMNLVIAESGVQAGYVQVLPLKTKLFKRHIQVVAIKLNFDGPDIPVIEGTLIFPLPDHKITLSLAGPVRGPSYALYSQPPLAQVDILGLLLFGRPTSELSMDDQGAAQRSSEILAQGVFSLAVLYFLAGSPIEYIGYDPITGGAVAQIGMGRKSALQVRRGREGRSSATIRRSLGKGWYLDTSVQETQGVNPQQEHSYGVLLERIIAY